jgi:hypothetical protein
VEELFTGHRAQVTNYLPAMPHKVIVKLHRFKTLGAQVPLELYFVF